MSDSQSLALSRTDSVSSTKSAYDTATLLKSSDRPITEYHVYHDAGSFLHSDLHIRSSNGQPLYYVSCNTMPSDGFDMKLHSGSTKDSPVLGGCRIEAASFDLNMAIGDPAKDVNKLKWQPITYPHFYSAVFGFRAPNSSGLNENFEWRRSHGKDVQDAGGKWFSMRNLTLVRMADESVVGVYVDNLFTGLRKKGKVQFREVEELGKEWELYALVAVLGINEKQRRKLRGTTSSNQPGGKFPI